MRQLISLLRGHFFTGLLVLIPLGVIAWLALAALEALWQLRKLLPDEWDPEYVLHPALGMLINVGLTVGVVLLLSISISLFGWASKQYLGRKVLDILTYIIERIPVIRSVYSALDQLLKTLAAQGGQQFNRVVYIEYPRKGTWTIAFVTGPVRGPEHLDKHLNVYVPTTPNPTSGFHLIVPESEVRDAHMRVEDAFKTILSLGIAQPSERGDRRSGHGS